MKKRVMEDMKARGVKITKISRQEIYSEDRKIPKKEPESLKPIEVREEQPQPEPTQTFKPTNTFVERESVNKISSTPRMARRNGGVRRSLVITLIITILVGGVYWIAHMFQNVNVNIVEKHQSFVLDHKQFNASDATGAPLEFQIMIVSDEQSKDVTLTESQDVAIKAKGVITLYNENSTKAQSLAIHTFVSDTAGKTYQTDKAVTIPGYKLDASKKIVPGTIDVGITAFLAGDSYNGSPSKFTINSFKGTAKFTKVYGKLKTPLSGGAQGLVYSLGPEQKGMANATAVSSFKSNLIKKVNAQVPTGYILYPNAMEFTYKTDEDVLSPTPAGKITISGTMSSVILKQEDLKKAVVKNILPGVSVTEANEIDLPDLANLSFDFANGLKNITKDMHQISFTLSGPLSAIWHPDVEKLRASIVGIEKVRLPSIFKTDPGIAEASVRIFPPWQSYLPVDPARVHIHVQ